MSGDRPLRLLLVEDSDLDAAHLQLELRRSGFAPSVKRVQTREEFGAALREGPWDIVVSDYTLPRFSAPEALQLFRASGLDCPFLVISGAVGEETAVELMRAGAHDYLLKHRLTRLGAAIERELTQAEERRSRRRAESLFQAVLHSNPLPSVILETESGRIVDGSSSFERGFPGCVIGERPRLLDTIDLTQPERINQLLARGSGTARHMVYRRDGVERMANVHCHALDHEGTRYAYLVFEDVTEQHYLKTAFDAVADALLVISADQTLLYANHAAEELFGSLYFGAPVGPFLSHPSLGTLWWQRPTARFEQQRVEISGKPHETRCVPFRFAGESRSSTIVMLRNVSEEEQLLHLATHDALTGIYNVRYFEQRLKELTEGAGDVTLALIDLDHFKPINDELGHAAGDAALILFSGIIRAELRPDDVFARLGGDEFALVLPDTALPAARELFDRLYRRLARIPFRFDGQTRPFSASAGLVQIWPGESGTEAKARADDALYAAKRRGRGRYEVAA